jgi:RimJ/RimL family protein N-acetyltransferase
VKDRRHARRVRSDAVPAVLAGFDVGQTDLYEGRASPQPDLRREGQQGQIGDGEPVAVADHSQHHDDRQHGGKRVDQVAFPRRDGRRLYGIWLDGLLVGGAGFATFDARDGDCSLGAWLAPEARGRGLVTSAARGMTEWAIGTRGTSRVEWSAAGANVRSIAVAKRLGMEREGVLRSAVELGGVRHDVEVCSLVTDRPPVVVVV